MPAMLFDTPLRLNKIKHVTRTWTNTHTHKWHKSKWNKISNKPCPRPLTRRCPHRRHSLSQHSRVRCSIKLLPPSWVNILAISASSNRPSRRSTPRSIHIRTIIIMHTPTTRWRPIRRNSRPNSSRPRHRAKPQHRWRHRWAHWAIVQHHQILLLPQPPCTIINRAIVNMAHQHNRHRMDSTIMRFWICRLLLPPPLLPHNSQLVRVS